MSRWDRESQDGRQRRNRRGRGEEPQRPTGKPSLGFWYLKGMATAIPSLLAGAIGLISTGSAAVAAVVAATVSAVASPAVESWFKGREIKAEAEAASAEFGSLGSAGAMARALATLVAVYELIDEITGQAEACGQMLKEGRSSLAAVMGGGNAIPQDLRDAYELNEEAQDDLKRVCSELGQAFAALRRFRPPSAEEAFVASPRWEAQGLTW